MLVKGTPGNTISRQIWVSSGSGNGLLPDGTKPLPELMLTYHQMYSWHSPEDSFTTSACELLMHKIQKLHWWNQFHIFQGPISNTSVFISTVLGHTGLDNLNKNMSLGKAVTYCVLFPFDVSLPWIDSIEKNQRIVAETRWLPFWQTVFSIAFPSMKMLEFLNEISLKYVP